MNICLACFEDRLASVFENASELKIYAESSDGDHLYLSGVGTIPLSGREIFKEVEAIQKQGSTLLICGAMCGRTRFALEQSGLKIMAWIKGDVMQVTEAYCNNTLESQIMPGCHNKRLAQGNCRNKMRNMHAQKENLPNMAPSAIQTNLTKG